MKRLTYDEIRNILSEMERGKGYFDFGIVDVCFDKGGVFKIYHRDKINKKTPYLAEATLAVKRWVSL